MIGISSAARGKPSLLAACVGVLVFGSVWGLLEATLGGDLSASNYAEKGALMGCAGWGIMGAYWGGFRRPYLIPFVGVVAALSKPLDAMIAGSAVTSTLVLNATTAIVLQATAFGVIATVISANPRESFLDGAVTGFTSAFAGYGAYALLASWRGFGEWAVWPLPERVGHALRNGLLIGVVGSLLVLLLFAAASAVRPMAQKAGRRQPNLARYGATSLIALCWIGAVIAYAS